MRRSPHARSTRIVCLAFFIAAAAFGVCAQDTTSSQDEMFRAQLIPRGSKIYIASFKSETMREGSGGNGFESYMAAALRKKDVPLLVVADPRDADFVIEGSAAKKGAGWTKKIFLGDYRGSASASMTVTNTKTHVVVYADSSDRASANRGFRSSAEKLAKYLKKKIEDDEKKIGRTTKQ